MWNDHLAKYYAPKNFNFWYFFGSLALLVLVIQIVTGIFLTMHYKPDASLNASGVPVAFASVEYIVRDVPWGWLIRYMHSTGASAFFIVVYLHMFRGMIYGSYRKPRELVWVFGVMLFLALMSQAFTGYLLPWGQMSYWGAQVILNLFSAIPLIGEPLSIWIRGDYVITDATLNRMFAFHVIAVPLVLVGLVAAHILALHEVGSNNPDGVEIKKKKDANGIPLDGIPFHPYYTVKDIVGVVVFLMVFSVIMFFMPEGGGYFLEYNNFIPADPLVTPQHIAPVWYFTPYYSLLRAVTYPLFGIDAKFWGVVAMGAGVMIFFFLPWLDRSPAKSIRYRGPIFKTFLAVWVVSFFILGYLGVLAPTPGRTLVAQICSVIYFMFFLAMPIYTKLDKCQPEPDRVTFK
ncbi:MAG: cytochrome b N-terminal domain-containing protein [Sulfurisoma sp.]|nr:cytochrome b N-terminal domain-containing protein [Sulfurisoma sp.]